MDQVKVVLAVIKKHHFWFLTGLVILVGVVVWWSATAGLADKIDSRKNDLEGKQKQVAGIPGETMHPNEKVIEAIKQERSTLEGEVFKAWEDLYNVQKRSNPWPQELGPPFLQLVTSMGPDQPIPETQRGTYQTFIQDHFKPLCEIIDIRLPAQLDQFGRPLKDEQTGAYLKIYPFDKPTAAARYGSTRGYDPDADEGYAGSSGSQRGELVGKVFWDQRDLDQLYQAFYWPTIPTTAQVRLAQEDLWVYEALLRIVKNTNEGATSHHNAAVKQIMALEIGRRASPTLARALGQTFSGSLGGRYGGAGGYDEGYGEEETYEEEGDGDDEGGSGYTPLTGAGGAGSSTATLSPDEKLRRDLLEYRYVDEAGLPLPAAQVLEDPPNAEYKLMPVRMLLVIDQRKIQRLLINCPNSSMPVLVRRLAYNPGKGIDWRQIAGSSSGRRYGGYGGGYEGEEDGGYGGGYSGGGYSGGGYSGGGYRGESEDGDEDGYSYRGRGISSAQSLQTSYDVPVEVLGVIQIFNPPKREKLGTGSADGEGGTPAAGSAPAAAAAPTSPAALAP